MRDICKQKAFHDNALVQISSERELNYTDHKVISRMIHSTGSSVQFRDLINIMLELVI